MIEKCISLRDTLKWFHEQKEALETSLVDGTLQLQLIEIHQVETVPPSDNACKSRQCCIRNRNK